MDRDPFWIVTGSLVRERHTPFFRLFIGCFPFASVAPSRETSRIPFTA